MNTPKPLRGPEKQTEYVQKWNQYGKIDWTLNDTNAFPPLLKSVNKISKKITLYHIGLISLMLILVGVFYFSNVYDGSFADFLGLKSDEAPAQTALATQPSQRYTSSVTPSPPGPTPPPGPVLPFVATATPEQYAQLEVIIPSNEMIQKLPADARIQMTFFNNNRGYWEPEKTYMISRGSMTPGTISNPEFIFGMNAKWVSQFTLTNFCDIMQTARANGESTVEAIGSKFSLIWKYKSVIGYRKCLGF